MWVFNRELRGVQCEQPHVLSFLFQAIAPFVVIEIFLTKTIYVFQSVLSYILLDLDDRKHSLYQISFVVVGIILARLILTDLVVF